MTSTEYSSVSTREEHRDRSESMLQFTDSRDKEDLELLNEPLHIEDDTHIDVNDNSEIDDAEIEELRHTIEDLGSMKRQTAFPPTQKVVIIASIILISLFIMSLILWQIAKSLMNK